MLGVPNLRAALLSKRFSPLDIPGLKLWLDASNAATLWQDTAGTTPATADGDPVGRWDDLSGQGNNATQGAASAQPALRLAIQGGRNVVRFDGVNDVIATALFGAALSQPTTIFVVYRNIPTSGTKPVFDGGATGGRQQFVAHGPSNAYIYAGTILNGSGQLDGASCRVVSALFNGASSQFWANGVSQGSGNAGIQALGRLALMSDSVAGGSAYTSGDICEVAVYSGALTAQQRARWESYAMSKWGI